MVEPVVWWEMGLAAQWCHQHQIFHSVARLVVDSRQVGWALVDASPCWIACPTFSKRYQRSKYGISASEKKSWPLQRKSWVSRDLRTPPTALAVGKPRQKPPLGFRFRLLEWHMVRHCCCGLTRSASSYLADCQNSWFPGIRRLTRDAWED